MTNGPSDQELKDHCCLESADHVPGDPEATAFKRRARLHQALWREARGLAIGTQPMRPQPGKRPRELGSRIAIDRAHQSGANFLDERVREAVRDRLRAQNRQQHETINKDRLYCDLLSSMPMCFNLFGPLHGDPAAADRAVHYLWPDVPGRVIGMCFEWSPGRAVKGEYLENRSAFDVAFKLALDDGTRGMVGIETKYHEHSRPEKPPSDVRCRRYLEIAEKSGAFVPGAADAILGTDLQQIWLDHLLALSMLLHPSRTWTWVRFVLVHPARNPSYARAAERYRTFLADPSTFEVRTIESLLSAHVMPDASEKAFRERYLW